MAPAPPLEIRRTTISSFSCCCGQGGHYLWRRVCDCNTAAYTCNNTCLIKTLREKNMYYTAAMELYGNVTEMYPDSQIWLAGHSLGGSVSSLLGLTFGLPCHHLRSPRRGPRRSETRPPHPSRLQEPRAPTPAVHRRVSLWPYRRPDIHGYMQCCDIGLYPRRLCDGNSMPYGKSMRLRHGRGQTMEGQCQHAQYKECPEECNQGV